MDVAASIQTITEEVMLRCARHVARETKMKYLVLAGGVALNCVGNGKIVSQYWCTTEASGIALTIKRRPLLLADTVRLHWATDWSTKDKPKLMRLLYECETLAVRVQEVLRDTSRRLAIQSLFNVISFLLAFAETPH